MDDTTNQLANETRFSQGVSFVLVFQMTSLIFRTVSNYPDRIFSSRSRLKTPDLINYGTF